MTVIVLGGSTPTELFSHMLLYGLASILEDAGVADLRLSWTSGMAPRPQVSATSLDANRMAEIVRMHATARTPETEWPSATIDSGGKPRGLMSPRLGALREDEAAWEALQRGRHGVLDELSLQGRRGDLQLFAGLGEPSYWRRNRERQLLQDDAASRLEMQPRNQGSEIVRNRFRALAASVSRRPRDSVREGVLGGLVLDEIGKDAPDSRTSTGLRSPGPTDNAQAWCALWGLSAVPVSLQVHQVARTSLHLGPSGRGVFVVPTWRGTWTLAHLRSVLIHRSVTDAASSETAAEGDDAAGSLDKARAWLGARGVTAVVRFPVGRFGSDSAPERRALAGQVIRLAAV